jgi:hypothetical protein
MLPEFMLPDFVSTQLQGDFNESADVAWQKRYPVR